MEGKWKGKGEISSSHLSNSSFLVSKSSFYPLLDHACIYLNIGGVSGLFGQVVWLCSQDTYCACTYVQRKRLCLYLCAQREVVLGLFGHGRCQWLVSDLTDEGCLPLQAPTPLTCNSRRKVPTSVKCVQRGPVHTNHVLVSKEDKKSSIYAAKCKDQQKGLPKCLYT